MSHAPRPPGLCRDCAADAGGDPGRDPGGGHGGNARRCPTCGSPRLIHHAELRDLHIAHLDCDAFYASVEKRDNPALRDKPVIVGGGGQRGVVAAACYIARIKGVHSAMPMFKARKACPEAIIVAPDMAKYVAVGRQIRTMMEAVTPLVEPLSIDEAFLDLGGTERLHGGCPAATLIRLIRRIEDEVGVTASIGLSDNKFLAKLASDLDKPRGFSVIGRAETKTFLADLPVNRIWGVGEVMHRRLRSAGISRIGQLQTYNEAVLIDRFGTMGRRLYACSRGRDSRRVVPQAGAKGMSTETTFADDVAAVDELKRRLWRRCERLAEQLKAKDLAGRTITLKLKTSGFRLLTRSHSLATPTQLAERIYRAALPMLERAADGTAYRLIGIAVAPLVAGIEADPGDLGDPEAGQRKRVEGAIDAVRAKLGRDAIGKGRSLPLTGASEKA